MAGPDRFGAPASGRTFAYTSTSVQTFDQKVWDTPYAAAHARSGASSSLGPAGDRYPTTFRQLIAVRPPYGTSLLPT
jgi:hypothetical protein